MDDRSNQDSKSVSKCAGTVRGPLIGMRRSYPPCTKVGRIAEDGKNWCATHAPSRIKARREASYAEYRKQTDAENERRAWEHKAIVACAGMSDPAAEIAKLRKALRDISEFGRKNPGYGHTCAEMALAALGAAK